MAKSNSRTTVFRGRKDKFVGMTLVKSMHNGWYDFKPSTTKAPHNIGRMNKTQRKDVARTTRQLKDQGLQDSLIKQHIGAGLIFNLVSRCEPQVSP